MLAVLLDPEKCREKMLVSILSAFEKNLPDFIFVGGSSKSCPTDDLFDALHDVPVPKILFSGRCLPIFTESRCTVFLSLISGRNPDYLIGQHMLSALEIKQSGIETIPTGYILIDGGNHSAVQRSQTILSLLTVWMNAYQQQLQCHMSTPDDGAKDDVHTLSKIQYL